MVEWYRLLSTAWEAEFWSTVARLDRRLRIWMSIVYGYSIVLTTIFDPSWQPWAYCMHYLGTYYTKSKNRRLRRNSTFAIIHWSLRQNKIQHQSIFGEGRLWTVTPRTKHRGITTESTNSNILHIHRRPVLTTHSSSTINDFFVGVTNQSNIIF